MYWHLLNTHCEIRSQATRWQLISVTILLPVITTWQNLTGGKLQNNLREKNSPKQSAWEPAPRSHATSQAANRGFRLLKPRLLFRPFYQFLAEILPPRTAAGNGHILPFILTERYAGQNHQLDYLVLCRRRHFTGCTKPCAGGSSFLCWRSHLPQPASWNHSACNAKRQKDNKRQKGKKKKRRDNIASRVTLLVANLATRTCICSHFGQQMAPLTLVRNMATCITYKFGHQVAPFVLPYCLCCTIGIISWYWVGIFISQSHIS